MLILLTLRKQKMAGGTFAPPAIPLPMWD